MNNTALKPTAASTAETPIVAQPIVRVGNEMVPLTLGMAAFADLEQQGFGLRVLSVELSKWAPKTDAQGGVIPGSVSISLMSRILCAALAPQLGIPAAEVLKRLHMTEVKAYGEAISRAVLIACGLAKGEAPSIAEAVAGQQPGRLN